MLMNISELYCNLHWSKPHVANYEWAKIVIFSWFSLCNVFVIKSHMSHVVLTTTTIRNNLPQFIMVYQACGMKLT